jgi:hypothetical protein
MLEPHYQFFVWEAFFNRARMGIWVFGLSDNHSKSTITMVPGPPDCPSARGNPVVYRRDHSDQIERCGSSLKRPKSIRRAPVR